MGQTIGLTGVLAYQAGTPVPMLEVAYGRTNVQLGALHSPDRA